MPSGKQVLLDVLGNLSQKATESSACEEVSETLRAALCAHRSTSSEAMEQILRTQWKSDSIDGEVLRQGIAIGSSGVFISDLFEELIQNRDMPTHLRERFPELSQADYESGLDTIWALLSAVQFWKELESVENSGDFEREASERVLDGFRSWLKSYREEPW